MSGYNGNEVHEQKRVADIRVAKFLGMKDAEFYSEQEREDIISANVELKSLRDSYISAFQRLHDYRGKPREPQTAQEAAEQECTLIDNLKRKRKELLSATERE